MFLLFVVLVACRALVGAREGDASPKASVPAAPPAAQTAPPQAPSPEPTWAQTVTPEETGADEPDARFVRLPKVVGLNGAIAQDKLSKLGVTNVQWGSAEPGASTVLLPANWRVTQQEPAAGTKVRPGDLVVLIGVKLSLPGLGEGRFRGEGDDADRPSVSYRHDVDKVLA